MRAICVRKPGGLERLEPTDAPDPGEPGPGEIRVRVRASSLNYHDYGIASGQMPCEDGRIPLSDAAGEVEAVGPGVQEFKPGNHVVSCFFPDWQDGAPQSASFARVPGDGLDGYACEYVVRPAHFFTRAPREMDDRAAASLPCAGLTAWRALVVNGGLKPGDRVLLLGTGGVSTFALMFARAMGARVAITSSSDAKLRKAREAGVEMALNYTREEKWGEAVREWADGRGVDHVVEVGGPATLTQSIAATRIGGHIALIGVLTGVKGEVPTVELMRKQIRLQGLVVGSRAQQQDMIRALDAGKLQPMIDRSFPLERLADAFRHEENGDHMGKIVIEV